MQLNKIRSTFLEFFKKHGHTIVPSSPLIPHNDPTLLFTAAGMVQFKNYFTFKEQPPYTTAASSQKCVRAGGKHNDLDNVGYTSRHHTFFEMLGNFSFGAYFKEQAIELAWKLLTEEFSLDKKRLYITIYHNDEEAYKIWKKLTSFLDDKIIRISTNDNFWAMGEVGPCGPCSEIFFDHGDKIAGGLPGTPEADGDRYVEIWNLVFMQFEDLPEGKRINLPKPSIDTGMGLERIAAVLQGKHDNFNIDLFQNLIHASKSISGDIKHEVSHRVIADHLRSICFLIADGVMPSNEGRGYVLRRIIRRATRHASNLKSKGAMLYKLVPVLVNEMGAAYPELVRAQAAITSILELEENNFLNTLDKGIKLLDENLVSMKAGDTLDGAIAFKLYDTYGFPLDLTSDILRSKDMKVDHDSFEHQMEEQKKRARAAWLGSGAKADEQIWFELYEKFGASGFLGYDRNAISIQAKVQAIIQDGKIVNEATQGEAIVILNQTPFYAESGGQVGDTGTIDNNEVVDTKRYVNGIIAHNIKVSRPIKEGDEVTAKIDTKRRNTIRSNHSATHLLHNALRATLGEHVTQKGSLVAHDRLRFDFSHNKPLSAQEIATIENIVNQMIIDNKPVDTAIKTPDEAIKEGAMALFGEKYSDEVRVVTMGISKELCGGTHVSATGDIGLFKIIAEESIASGVRRIEALTGLAAVEYLNNKQTLITEIAGLLKSSEADLIKKITSLLDEKKGLAKEISQLKLNKSLQTAPKESGPFKYYKVSDIAPGDLKPVADAFRQKFNSNSVIIVSCIVDRATGQKLNSGSPRPMNWARDDDLTISSPSVIASEARQSSSVSSSVIIDNRASVVVTVSNDLKAQVKARDIIKSIIEQAGGSGGGNDDFAQAGGIDAEKLDQAIDQLLNK